MKILLCFLALVLSLHSCSVDTSVPDNYDHQGNWELVRTKSNIANAEFRAPEIQETYTFRNNGDFIKTRKEGASEVTAQGSYKLVQRPWSGTGEPLLFLDLEFDAENPLIANCSMEPVEHLIITSEFLLVNTWIACDGFLMEYEKKETS